MRETSIEEIKNVFNEKNPSTMGLKDAIRTGIKKAYRDTQRTFRGVHQEQRDELLIFIENEFEKYFDESTKTKDEFDEWHKNICEEIHKEAETKAVFDNGATYGQIQKIVNMTFKYIYHYLKNDVLETMEEKFKYCHMPIDGYILRWFNCEVIENSDKRKLPKWSKLDYDNGDSQYYSYKHIQNLIYEYFCSEKNKYQNLTPFQAEFYIWAEEQVEIASDGCLGEIEKFVKNKKQYDYEFIDDILKKIQDMQNLLKNLHI